ncbi:MAG: ATP-binding cassette domain-containing protein [Zhenhengia sp.]|jgi:cobalt/nickel transport system ATP-binding protein|uniref:ATP-binding cassette domain-containing protein n=1 Tax=Zhenhengia sp. TaxID=2944208 RepID=UPI0029149CF4|nr:ATP-binding cassette domain-containing protein [Clostridiales bacterium]MDU6974773.1 ATP-binding cassette domain-containing protein [Clostridiales bacterium]
MSANIIMETKQLCFNYPDGTPALKDLSIQIKKGKTTGILGGNGAGKSTLFLNLNGILRPTSGQVYHKNLPISYSSKSLNQLRQSVGIVFQDPDTQLFSASVYQDVSFGVVNLGIPESEAHLRTENALKRTGTYELRQKPTHSLSYGQKKRVALAGIIAMEPEVLILDEPTAGLDPQGVSEIMQLIRELQQDLGIAILIATHDMDLVPMYCDYIYLLNQGEIVGCGSPDEIFNQPSLLRQIHLRLPRIGHLMELLKTKDGFPIEGLPVSISHARKELSRIFHLK